MKKSIVGLLVATAVSMTLVRLVAFFEGRKGPGLTLRGGAMSPLRLGAVHIDDADGIDSQPAVNLTFDVSNDGDREIGEIVLELTIRSTSPSVPQPRGRSIAFRPTLVRPVA